MPALRGQRPGARVVADIDGGRRLTPRSRGHGSSGGDEPPSRGDIAISGDSVYRVAEREVHVMILRTIEEAAGRKPTIKVWF